MNWLDKVGQMFGGGQQQPQQIDNPYQNQMALQNAQMQKQRAMQMQDAQYQGGGAVGILAGLAQILKGKSLDRKADESITQALGRQFEFDNQRAMKEAEQRAAEDEKRWQRELKKIEEQERLRAQYRQPQGPTRVGNSLVRVGQDGKTEVLYTDPQRTAPERVTYGQPIEVMGPDGPMLVRPASDGSMVPLQGFRPSTSQAKATPEERETAKAEATRIKEAEDRARAAAKTLENVARMEAIMAKGLSTGPLDRFLPGKDRALFDSLASDLNLSTLKQNFGGNPTEGERAANAATLPGAAQYEANNKQLLAKLRAEAQAKIDEYNALTGKGRQPSGGQSNPGATGDPLIDKYL